MNLTDAIEKLEREGYVPKIVLRGGAAHRLDQLTGHTKLLEACRAVILRTGRPEIHVLVRLCEEAVAATDK